VLRRPTLPSLLLILASGCIYPQQHLAPLTNASSTNLGEANFRVARTGLRGEASCIYLFDLFALGDPGVATAAMEDLSRSAAGEGKPQALVNLAADILKSNWIVITIVRVKVRADLVEFREPPVREPARRPPPAAIGAALPPTAPASPPATAPASLGPAPAGPPGSR
jgi:hypothetical protein